MHIPYLTRSSKNTTFEQHPAKTPNIPKTAFAFIVTYSYEMSI